MGPTNYVVSPYTEFQSTAGRDVNKSIEFLPCDFHQVAPKKVDQNRSLKRKC